MFQKATASCEAFYPNNTLGIRHMSQPKHENVRESKKILIKPHKNKIIENH